jgi:hypothetical protein
MSFEIPATVLSTSHCLLRSIRTLSEGTIASKDLFGSADIYADLTSPGGTKVSIEDYLRRQNLPYYANTHTEASATDRKRVDLRHMLATPSCDALKSPPAWNMPWCSYRKRLHVGCLLISWLESWDFTPSISTSDASKRPMLLTQS